MKLPVVISGLVVSLALAGCSSQSPVASSTDVNSGITTAPTIAYEDMPPVAEANITLDCSTFAEGAKPFVRQESDLVVDDVKYRVATVACGMLASEVSAEVIESFVADNGVWASNGLVSGADVPFNTSGPCQSDGTTVKCPAFVLSEEGEAVGHIEISGQDNGLVWTFVAE